MRNKTAFVMQENWDYLIILDACRYDYFEKFCEEYLSGKLEKRISLGSSTREWRDRNFTGKYDDTIYISANPFINSVKSVQGFLGADHFHKVYDLWLNFWDENVGTVLPGVVTDQAISIIGANVVKRTIIHYVQPHEPYLSLEDLSGFALPRSEEPVWRSAEGKRSNELSRKLFKLFKGILYWLGIRGNLLLWRFREVFNLPPENPMDAARRRHGKQGLRDAYKENLKAVLSEVDRLVGELSGTIVVTADHGEMLGEWGCYCHWNRARKKELLEIPWLVIKKGDKTVHAEQTKAEKKQEIPQSPEEQKKIEAELADRLKALGY